MDEVETILYKDFNIKIYQDENPALYYIQQILINLSK